MVSRYVNSMLRMCRLGGTVTRVIREARSARASSIRWSYQGTRNAVEPFSRMAADLRGSYKVLA